MTSQWTGEGFACRGLSPFLPTGCTETRLLPLALSGFVMHVHLWKKKKRKRRMRKKRRKRQREGSEVVKKIERKEEEEIERKIGKRKLGKKGLLFFFHEALCV